MDGGGKREEAVCGVKVETALWQRMVISIPVESVIPSTQWSCPVSTTIKNPQQPVHCAEKTQYSTAWMVVTTVLTAAAWTLHWTERTVQTSLQAVPRRHLLSQHKTPNLLEPNRAPHIAIQMSCCCVYTVKDFRYPHLGRVSSFASCSFVPFLVLLFNLSHYWWSIIWQKRILFCCNVTFTSSQPSLKLAPVLEH